MTRKLHIGGKVKCEGWEVLNVQPGPHVDHLGDAGQLLFLDETFDVIYASHILEHIRQEPIKTLKEWARVLKPDGTLYLSVPNIHFLFQMFLLTPRTCDRFDILKVIYGAHIDKYDYHVTGFDEEMIRILLFEAGFKHIERCEEFGLFDDCSTLRMNYKLLSLNMVATKQEKDNVIPLETAL